VILINPADSSHRAALVAATPMTALLLDTRTRARVVQNQQPAALGRRVLGTCPCPQRGVRSIVRDGIRSIEPVTIDPRGGIEVNRDLHPEYATARTPEAPEAPPAETAPETFVEPPPDLLILRNPPPLSRPRLSRPRR
jgi:hypothetical protein